MHVVRGIDVPAYDLARFRAYSRLAPGMATDDDCLLYLEAAVAGLSAQGVRADRLQGDRLYELTIYMMALHYHDNRGLIIDKVGTVPDALLPIVNALHYTPEAGESP